MSGDQIGQLSVHSYTRRQVVIALSSDESEYYGIGPCCVHGIWPHLYLNGSGLCQSLEVRYRAGRNDCLLYSESIYVGNGFGN
eukprot:5010728-Amphidinium_carterae.1